MQGKAYTKADKAELIRRVSTLKRDDLAHVAGYVAGYLDSKQKQKGAKK